jgi:hypothetical protein
MPASLSGALSLINANHPDNTDGDITPASTREILFYLAVLADQAGGGSSLYLDVTIDSSNDGSTFTISGATASRQIVKNGITLVPGTDYTFAAPTWTWAEDAIVGDNYLIIYE